MHVKVLNKQNGFVCLHNLNQLYDIKKSWRAIYTQIKKVMKQLKALICR